jgi:putative ABC transport system permease protein
MIDVRRKSVDDGVQFQREEYIEQLQADGHTRVDAERIARIELGGFSQVKDQSKDAWSLSLIQGLSNDFRFSFRMLVRHWMFSAASILTLGLGIGATTAVFSVVDVTLLRPLPFSDPDRLTILSVYTMPNWNGDVNSLFAPSQIELLRWREARSFESMDAIEPRLIAISGQRDPEVVNGGAVTSGLFSTLGVAPSMGRVFTVDEEKADARVAVISDAFAKQHFNGGGSPIGKNLVIDGASYEVAGVMPQGFHVLIAPSEIWIPLRPVVDPNRAGLRIMNVIAKLRHGVSREQARQELAAISTQIARDFPSANAHASPLVRDFRQQIYGTKRPALLMLAGAVALLLLLACVNVFNLMLGHLSIRRAEFAIRAVIGGGRWRLARLQLVETGLLALIGGTLGIAVMNWVVSLLLALYSRPGQPPIDASLDLRVAAFGLFITLTVAIVGGVIPALRTHESGTETALARVSAARVGGGFLERRIRAGLVVAQVALAVTLLCAAGVFLTSLRRIMATEPGFSPERVWTGQLRLPPLRYKDVGARARFVGQLLERISLIPGVVAAGTTQTTFQPNQSMQTQAWVEGRTTDAQNVENFHIRHVTPGYFAALRAPVVEGRAIDDRDQQGTTPVCMVNARLARQIWPNESAIGHRIRRNNPTAPWMMIVGVAGDVMDNGLGVQPDSTLYVAYLQQNTVTARVSLVVRVANDGQSYGRDIERAIWSVDPAQPIDGLGPLTGVLTQSIGDQRFQTVLLSSFALLGLLLAMIGVYGVTAAAVTARTWEMGVRMALGATSASVILNMLFESVKRILLGVVAGITVFFAIGRLAASLLYKTSFADPRILIAAIMPLVLIAFAISYFQARHLSKVNPVIALRNRT